MIALNDRLPRYLLEKEQIWTTVVYTALFSLIFILVSIPFSGSAWFALGESDAFIYTLAFVLLSALLVILSRSLMHRCRDLKGFTLLGYIAWNVAEVVVVALLYTVFTRRGMEVGIIEGERETGEIFLSALVYTAVCLCVPFAFCALHFALQDRDNTIRLMNYGNVVSDKPAKPYSDKRITLFDNNGVLKFSISSDNLYFIESDDNYIKVWYMDSAGEMKQPPG